MPGQRSEGSGRIGTVTIRIIVCSATAALFALLNRASAFFEVAEGVSLVFPASALALVAAALSGWWGVAAAFVGFMVSPWGLQTDLFRLVFFSLAVTVQAAVPALARFRPVGTTTARVLRVVSYGAVVNTLLSALVAVPGVALLANPPFDLRQTGLAFASWFLGDMTTIVLLGVPALLLLRPSLLLDDVQLAIFRRWAGRWRLHVAMAVLVAAVVAAMEVFGGAWLLRAQWIAVFLLVPVLVNAAIGAVGGGLLTNGLVGIVYVGEVLHLARPATRPEMFQHVFSSYLNLAVFAVAAIVAGLFAGRSRALLAELEDHRRQLQDGFERVVTALAAAIEAKDSSTQGHVQRVARLAVAVGRRMGLDGPRAEMLRYAAILHDVGKIGIPEDVLNKRGPLGPEERRLMEEHVRIGVEILRSVDVLSPAIPFIQYHHERWDGRTDGAHAAYHGLKGDEIPLEARIIAVVDAFDAMTYERPNRTAQTNEDAIAELRREAGAQFDPAVAQALIDVVEGRSDAESSGRWPVLGGAPDRWHPSRS
jgi:putative nucleotidyltransferase with HDIG domain